MNYQPTVVGVLNLSPESNIKESIAQTPSQILARAQWLTKNGANIIELGARSISDHDGLVSETQEQERLYPAIELLKSEGYRIGVDTWSSDTGCKMLGQGIDLLNFTASELDEELLDTVAYCNTPMVTTYLPVLNAQKLNQQGLYIPSLQDLINYFTSRIQAAKTHQVKQLIIDPNLGILHDSMDKLTKVHMQIQIIRWFDELRELGCPIYVYSPWKSDEVGIYAMASTIVHHRADYIRTHFPHIITSLLGFKHA